MTSPVHGGTFRVAFAGGGTGGHLFPGLAVAMELRHQCPTAACTFYGSGRPIEREHVPRYGFPFHPLAAAPRPTNPLGWPRFLVRNYWSYRQARAILADERVDLVVGLGGYGAAPMARAAGTTGVPVVLLEQNSVPGRANRYLSRWATAICAAFERSRAYFPADVHIEMTGNPLRREFVEGPARPIDPAQWGLDPAKLTLAVSGGSQGASNINQAMAALADDLAPFAKSWQVVHQTGPWDGQLLRDSYAKAGLTAHVAEFFNDMADVYRLANVVVARAGAGAVAELACLGRPAVFVPYPFAADDHQTKNAEEAVRHGGAVLVPDRRNAAATAPALWEALAPILSTPAQRDHMARAMATLARPDAARHVVAVITDILCRRRAAA